MDIAEVFADGFGRIDGRGYVQIVGRGKTHDFNFVLTSGQ